MDMVINTEETQRSSTGKSSLGLEPPARRCSLMELPTEMRLQIYEEVLQIDNNQVNAPTETYQGFVDRHEQLIGSTAILLASRIMKDEVQDILDGIPFVLEYRQGLGFCFHRQWGLYPTDSKKLKQKDRVIPSHALGRMRNVTIVLTTDLQLPSISPVVNTIFSDFGTTANLRRLKIVCDCWSLWSRGCSAESGKPPDCGDIQGLELDLMPLASFKQGQVDLTLCSRYQEPSRPRHEDYVEKLLWRTVLQSMLLRISVRRMQAFGEREVKKAERFVGEEVIRPVPYSVQ